MLSKLSLPDYVQFHLQPPRGGVWELKLSHSLSPTHLHINPHTQTPLLAMTHLVPFYFCGFPCLKGSRSWLADKITFNYPSATHLPTYPFTQADRHTDTHKHIDTHTLSLSPCFLAFPPSHHLSRSDSLM